MKIKSCAWLVCLILCLPVMMRAQVLKIENGMAFSSLVNEGEDLFDKSLSSYQMSIGLDYLDQGWYELSSNVGYLRKGGSFDFYETTDMGLGMHEGHMKYRLDYITLNTTFRVKTLSDSGWNFYAGAGPRVDVNVKRHISLGDMDSLFPGQTAPAVNRIIVGLKCEAGVNYNFDRYLLGLNVSYLPSFIKPNKDFIARDRTFTVGILLGYRL
ncbi:outer membrane beta-barrel protein [uncultured Parabacteroides sp.]|uniref:outer membrane beta-barrel protein n=1 Tax=uncultured Parabacteroides sp. TaxID=512312 RepID=UPI002615C042|nr:outer membrane beta-barrel protein [uncultured Parabacteroides sp.]